MSFPSEFAQSLARLVDILQNTGLRVATLESCTGGLLGMALTSQPGSSQYYTGGIICYDNAVKEGLLGVPGELLAREGAVSAAVAEAMIAGGWRRFPQVDMLVAVTGIAGPGGGSASKPVGLVYLAVATRGATAQVQACQFPGDRHTVRFAAGQTAFDMLYEQARLRTIGS